MTFSQQHGYDESTNARPGDEDSLESGVDRGGEREDENGGSRQDNAEQSQTQAHDYLSNAEM